MEQANIDLNGEAWQFGQVPRRPFTDFSINDLANVAEWLPATVPGNVETDLLALGRIPDPFFGENYRESRWVEGADWWYRRSVTAELPAGGRAFLVCEGIDYLSAIFVNGRERSRHEGMFSPQVVDMTEALRAGPAEIAVRLWGSEGLPRRQLSRAQRTWQAIAGRLYSHWSGVYPDRSATLKCQMSFGWDFAPPIRTMGLWDDVRLVISGPVCLLEAGATGRPSSANPAAANSPATLSLHLALDADRPRPVKLIAHLSPANFTGPSLGPFTFRLDLPGGRSRHRLELTLSDVALWQPWDRGQPCLYAVHLHLADSSGRQLLDEVTCRTGFCAVSLADWRFTVNGQAEFIRGLNWVPADSLPGRLTYDRYAVLLRQSQASGANLLRVWGGGLREKRVFYDLCDELGLLVWQEFPFACMFLGGYPADRAYLSRVEAECTAIVRQGRPHPSLALWCGGNEFSPSRNRPLLATLAAVVRQHDGARPFLPVSPDLGQGQEVHAWGVWHGSYPLRAYQAETARFISEFGLQALPALATLQAALPDPTRDWPSHSADLPKLARYLAPMQQGLGAGEQGGRGAGGQGSGEAKSEERGAWSVDGRSSNLQPLITHSQRAQAIALQTAIEFMRRRRNEAGGLCVWQFNEPWPAISWAIVDYFGRPKLAGERLADWYRPVLVCLDFPAGRRWQAGDTFKAAIWAINDSPAAIDAARLEVWLDERSIHSQALDLPANSGRRVGTLNCTLAAPPSEIRLVLTGCDQQIATNSYDLTWFDESRPGLVARLKRWLGRAVLG